MSQDGGPQISWADGVNADLLKNAALGMESRRYWKARRAGTLVRGTEDLEKPNWDDVVARAIVAKCAKKHRQRCLPTPTVVGPSTESSAECAAATERGQPALV